MYSTVRRDHVGLTPLTAVGERVCVCACVVLIESARVARAQVCFHFMASLAIADILVASLVMSVSVAYTVLGHWPFGWIFCRCAFCPLLYSLLFANSKHVSSSALRADAMRAALLMRARSVIGSSHLSVQNVHYVLFAAFRVRLAAQLAPEARLMSASEQPLFVRNSRVNASAAASRTCVCSL